MTGVRYITDDKGERTDVVINLRKHGKNLEDFFVFLVFEERKNEETVSLESILDELKAEGRYKSE